MFLIQKDERSINPTVILPKFNIAVTMWKRNCPFVSFGFSFIALLSTFSLASLWTNKRLLDIERQLFTMEMQLRAAVHKSPTQVNKVVGEQTYSKWSDVKIAIYMTTHLPESHLIYFLCWYDAIQRMDIFTYADLILYTSSQPTSMQLALLPFRNTIVKQYNNTGYQNGAIQAMIDPYIENVTWFDGYDWVIRLNPDVLIRNDTWLIQTMLNTSIDGIFHDCFNSKNYSKPNPKLHTDFYAFRPSAVDRDMVLKSKSKNAEFHITGVFRNIYNAGRFAFVEGASNSRPGRCRIEGEKSPVVHSHDLWKACPYYYNSTKEGVY
jgi:hypothetical protein